MGQDIAIKDFSVYDGGHLVYIHHEEDTGGWYMDKEDVPTAKHSTNPTLINQYQTLFNAMYNSSLPYEKNLVDVGKETISLKEIGA